MGLFGFSYKQICGAAIVGYVVFAAAALRLLPLRKSKGTFLILKKAHSKTSLGGANLPHTHERFPFATRSVGHRGGSLLGQENTIFTFKRALEAANVNVIELDCHESQDGVPVVAHESDLLRITGKPGDISKITVGKDPSASLPTLTKVIPLTFQGPPGVQEYHCDHQPQRLSTLREVYEAMPPDTILHLDIKTSSVKFVETVVELTDSFNRLPRTVIGSMGQRNTKALRALLAKKKKEKGVDSHTFASIGEVMTLHVIYYLGLLPFVSLPFDFYSVPIPTTDMMEWFREKGWMRWIGHFVGRCFYAPGMWRHMQRRGIVVIGWVVNSEHDFEEAYNWPINGIMTDDPLALKAFFERKEVEKGRKTKQN